MKPRVLVDPRVQEAEDAFQRMMVRFKAKTREENIRDGIARVCLMSTASRSRLQGPNSA